MRVIGIDPGKTGHICEIDSISGIVRNMPLPFRADDVVDYNAIARNFDLANADLRILEKVSAQPKWSACSAMTFGKIVGQIEMILSRHSFVEIASRTWQKSMHVGLTDSMKPKEKSAAAFYRLNANFKAGKKKPSHDYIDAFLIAAHGIKTLGGNIQREWAFENLDARA